MALLDWWLVAVEAILFYVSLLSMTMRLLVSLALVLAMGASPAWSAERLVLDAEKSKIEFVGKKTDLKQPGGFKTFKADAVADFTDPTGSKLEIVIDTVSIWSGDEKLTNHLKNPDFFDVRKHPKVTFVTTKIVPTGEGKADISGDLTMLGKTVAVTIPAEVQASDQQVTIKTAFALDRTQWGMNFGLGNILSEVDVKAELVFAR